MEKLIEKFIKGSSGSLAKRALRSFAFDQASPNPTDCFRRTHPDVDIVVEVKEESVGVKVRRETYVEEKARFIVTYMHHFSVFVWTPYLTQLIFCRNRFTSATMRNP